MKHAVCILAIRDGLVLSVTRKDQPDQWGFPGGKVEESDRTERAAAVRELYEETGIGVHSDDLTLVYGGSDGEFWVTTYLLTPTHVIKDDALKCEDSQRYVLDWKRPAELCDPSTSPFAAYNAAVFAWMEIIQQNS